MRGEKLNHFSNTKWTVATDSDCVPPSLGDREGGGETEERHKEGEKNEEMKAGADAETRRQRDAIAH